MVTGEKGKKGREMDVEREQCEKGFSKYAETVYLLIEYRYINSVKLRKITEP